MAYQVILINPVDNTFIDITNNTMGITISETLDKDVTRFEVLARNLPSVYMFYTMYIYKDNSLLISGRIINQKDSDGGHLKEKTISFACEDWGYILSKRIVAGNYTNMEPSELIRTLLIRYAPEINPNNINKTATSFDRMMLPYITLKEAIENIMDLIPDWHWYIDRNKNFHLFYRHEGTGTTFTKNNIDINTLSVEHTGHQHFNRIWMIGRKQASPNTIDVYFSGDGIQRYFVLPYEPNDTKIYVNNVLKESSLEGNDNGARDFLINKKEKVIYIPDYKEPVAGTIRVNFKPTKQFVDYYENQADQKNYGLSEKAIKNQNLKDKLEARRFGLAEVKRKSEIKRTVSFQSKQSTAFIGQKVRVEILSNLWNIQGSFLVKATKKSITPGREQTDFELEEIL